jgi:hypothetical protein
MIMYITFHHSPKGLRKTADIKPQVYIRFQVRLSLLYNNKCSSNLEKQMQSF